MKREADSEIESPEPPKKKHSSSSEEKSKSEKKHSSDHKSDKDKKDRRHSSKHKHSSKERSSDNKEKREKHSSSSSDKKKHSDDKSKKDKHSSSSSSSKHSSDRKKDHSSKDKHSSSDKKHEKKKSSSSETASSSGSTSKSSFKKGTYKGVDGKYSYDGDVLTSDEDVRKRDGYTEPIPKKNSDGVLIFKDCDEFRPNLTPKEVLQAGSFGGTYFRPIKSGVTGLKYDKMWNELPQNWLEGLNIKKTISSSLYDESVNTYKAKCGGSLEMWESSGWIKEVDPYGWFMWYCRFYLGRRCDDDDRQIGRWKNCCGPKGRWKNNLIGKIARAGVGYDNRGISPVVRQTLQHWGYRLTEKDYQIGKKRVKM